MKRAFMWWIGLIGLFLLLFVIFPRVPALRVGFANVSMLLKAANGAAGGQILDSLKLTFMRFGAAGFVGCTIGVLLGSIRAWSSIFRQLSAPWVDIGRITPAIVWIPVLLLFKANSSSIPFWLGTLYATVYISLEVESRLRDISVDERTYLVAQRFSWLERFQYSYLSRLLAGLASGSRLGLSVALILVVVGEALTGASGLGQQLTGYQTALALGELWLTILVLSGLALLAFYTADRLATLVGAKK